MVLQMYPDIGLNCILLLWVFVFLIYTFSHWLCKVLVPWRRTAHFVWGIMNAEQVLLCYVYKNVHGDSSDNTTKPSNTVITQRACLKETWTPHSYNVLLSTYISFYCCIYHPTLRHLRGEHDLYQNINHHSLYVNKFRISPFTMRTSTRAGNATFPELINHTHWVIWQSTPNTGWGAAIPRAQTHTI